ncbi:MAG: hypothetical protein HON90_00415 [Halobacteriovoraceae bacterium]|jgi:YegS/Rv2252/BmrU family lipid kinase|nr:hypothetical protein [Halobacteriovoraceae bacterium]
MHEISVYFNKIAGNSLGRSWEDEIRSSLFRSDLSFNYQDTLEELNQKLKKDLADKKDVIISVGGDGTVNTIIQQMAGTQSELLVIPGGTANDLASELGNKASIKKIANAVRSGSIKAMDLISVNGRYMATNGGIGFGANVADSINSTRAKIPMFKKIMQLSGKKIYTTFMVKELLLHPKKRYELKITTNGATKYYSALGLLINNQSTIGGTFKVAPETLNDDGLFNITILTHKGLASAAKCIYQVARGLPPNNDPHFITFETSSAKIESVDGKPLMFFGDGEVFGENHSWDIKLAPSSLQVFSNNISSKCSLDFLAADNMELI